MKKKQIILMLLLLVLAVTASACAKETETPVVTETPVAEETGNVEDDYVVQMPTQTAICGAPIFNAIELGFLEEEGVKFDYINSETNAWDLIAAGKGDVAYGLLPTFVQRIANGFDLTVVMGAHHGCINVVTSENSDIHSITDLKGKRVGIPGSLGSDPAIMLQRVLLANDIAISDVDIQVYTNPDLETALSEGHIDAFVSWDPYATAVSRKTNGRIIFNSASDDLTKDEYCCVLALRNEFVEEHPEVAERFVRAIAKANDYIEEHPEETAKMIYEKGYVADPDYVLNGELLDSYNYSAKYQSAKDSFIKVTQDLSDLDIISINVSPEEFADKVFENVGGLE